MNCVRSPQVILGCYSILVLHAILLRPVVDGLKVVSPVERADDYFAVVAAFGPPLVTTRDQTAEVIAALPWYSGVAGGSIGCSDVEEPDDFDESAEGQSIGLAGVFHGGSAAESGIPPEMEQQAKAATAFTNWKAFAGKIVMIPRGGCTFRNKVSMAQRHGAIGVIVVDKNNRKPGQQFFQQGQAGKGGDISLALLSDDGHGHEIMIPTEMISFQDGGKLLQTLVGERKKVVAQMGVHLPAQSFYY